MDSIMLHIIFIFVLFFPIHILHGSENNSTYDPKKIAPIVNLNLSNNNTLPLLSDENDQKNNIPNTSNISQTIEDFQKKEEREQELRILDHQMKNLSLSSCGKFCSWIHRKLLNCCSAKEGLLHSCLINIKKKQHKNKIKEEITNINQRFLASTL